jgi:hypothetical protein
MKGDNMDRTVTVRDVAMIESSLKMLTDEQLELALEASIRCLDTWRQLHSINVIGQRSHSV